MDEQTARERLKKIVMPDDSLDSINNSSSEWYDGYVQWDKTRKDLILDGWFDADTLEAIVWWIRNKKQVKEKI